MGSASKSYHEKLTLAEGLPEPYAVVALTYLCDYLSKFCPLAEVFSFFLVISQAQSSISCPPGTVRARFRPSPA